MGLWPWGLMSQILTKKFWNSVKKDGWLLTYTRGHKAVMNTHTVGGNTQRAHYVGCDQYGNRYYEDFTAIHYHHRRWVEYNDYLSPRTHNGDMIPPKWHGWLSHQYDDVPQPDGDSFYDPFFEKTHDWNSSYSAQKVYTDRKSSINPLALDYHQYRVGRYAKEWNPTTKRN